MAVTLRPGLMGYMSPEPELTQSGRNISPALDHIVKHCLEKDRGRRFQSARDVESALEETPSSTFGVGVEVGV
jgi:hypothetical protein